MKSTSIICLFVSVAVITASGVSWDQLPTFHDIDVVDPKMVEENFETLHPWKQGMPLPGSFEEAGLTLPVSLVATSYHFDGGSRVYIFRGMNGKFLVFCTETMIYGKKDGTAERVTAPRLFIGTFHFTEKPRTVVPEDSPTEGFLIAALAAESERASEEK